MAREQIQVPFDTNSNSDKDQEGGQAKSLGRPRVPSTLQKPKIEQFKATLYRHCSCGNKVCRSPVRVDPQNPWIWIYRDKNTDAIVDDPILPKQGGEPGWDWR